MKKFLLPVMTILVATGAAMASETSVQSSTEQAYRIGKLNEEPCVPVPKNCSITGVVACTWFDGSMNHQLYALDGTVCGDELFEIVP